MCGKCVTLCIHGAREICGEELTAGEFAGRILKHGDFLRQNKGGVTISGGEPLAQPDFLIELLNALKEFHIALDTSGYGESKIFKEAIRKVKLVLFDIKLTDPELHIKHTGKDNRFILENLSFLVSSSIPFYVRMPVIPGLNDNEEHFRKTAELVKNAPGLLGIDILPYQHTAGAKYSQLGRIYNPSFDQTGKITIPDYIFTQYFIRSRIL
ncbi:MAG TPA: pyruvate formate lyase-activating protein [Spirochaetia bacterium]|nr:pyruvate formate lyase-activating protein [Spirochaetia bacterium]